MTPEHARAFLHTRGWLRRTPDDFRTAFLAGGRLRTFAPGNVVANAGDQDVGMFAVLEGQLGFLTALNGEDAPLAQLVSPGQWGGGAPVVGLARMATTVARVQSQVFFVPMAHIRILKQQRADFFECFAAYLVESYVFAATLAGDLMARAADRRLAAVLLSQAGCRHSGAAEWPLHLSHAEAGAMASLSRQPASELIARFERKGWIRRSYRRIDIEDPESLRRLADGD